MAELFIKPFSEEYSQRWDHFVLEQSANGTFQQTRQFLNYHPKGRFIDNSLMFIKGTEIIGVISANLIQNEEYRVLCSHRGSTFGGIIIEKRNIKVSVLEKIFEELDVYCKKNNISKIDLKMTSELYSRDKTELMDYMLFNHGYKCTMEVGYYVDFKKYNQDIPSNYSSSVRRHYKASCKNGLMFKEERNRDGIKLFYEVLLDNYKKFDKCPAHSLDDLYYLQEEILKDRIRFFCVYKDEEVVASSMVFDFDHKVFHTQYLASKYEFSNLYVNEFLYTSLIETAREGEFPYLSFGTTTLEEGYVLNYNLAQYKEQYGTEQYVNRTYHKSFD